MDHDDDRSLTDKVSDDAKHHVVRDDDPRGVGVGPEDADSGDAMAGDDEHVVPPGADDEVKRAQSWVKGDEPPAAKEQQVEGDGFR